MKALVFHKPKDVSVDTVDDPRLEEARDAIIRVTSTAICGSDLHIYNGLIPQAKNMILGHEFMGIVEEVGPGVKNLKRGDRVVVPFPISCGACYFCNHALPNHCEHSNEEKYGPEGDLAKGKGGGIFGYTDLYGGYNGGQAELVRVPYADYGPRIIENGFTDEEVLFLTDIFPTGWAAIDWANIQGGETVVVFGCGPVGIMAMKSAWLKGAGRVIGVDVQPYRLEIAANTANVEVINSRKENVVEAIRAMTQGRGADVCVDAVGMEADRNILDKAFTAVRGEVGSMEVLQLCFDAVRRGGMVSVVGVYAAPFRNFPIHQMFDKGVSFRGGQAPVHTYIDTLLDLVKENKVKLNDIITHTLPLSEASNAYTIFNKKEDNCLKVILKP